MAQPFDAVSLKGASQCPHCGNVGVVLESSELRQVCGLCGAPRVVPSDESIKLSGREAPALREAQKARRNRMLWRSLGLVSGSIGAFWTLASLIVMALGAGTVGFVLAIAGILPLLLLTITAITRSRANGAAIQQQLDEAWKSAARDVVLSQNKAVTAASLAKALPISEAAAETLLAQLSVDDSLRSDVTDDGQVAFSVHGSRIEVPQPAAPADDLEKRFAALEESLADEAAADANRHQKR
jgi:hypothetical protein